MRIAAEQRSVLLSSGNHVCCKCDRVCRCVPVDHHYLSPCPDPLSQRKDRIYTQMSELGHWHG